MNVRAQRAVSNVIKVLDSISTPAGASSNSSVWIDLVGDKDNSFIYKLKFYLRELLKCILPASNHVNEGLASPVFRNTIRKF